MDATSSKPSRRRRFAGAVLAASISGSTWAMVDTTAAGATLPTTYFANAVGQGLSAVFDFTGSPLSPTPLVNPSAPYAEAALNSQAQPSGFASAAFPGTVALVATNLGPVLVPESAPLTDYGPIYPYAASVDGSHRSSEVGAPVTVNRAGTMRVGASHQACHVAQWDDAVDCTAFLTDVVLPDNAGLSPDAPASPESEGRLAAWRGWRDRLDLSLQQAGGRALADDTKGTLARVAQVKVRTHVDVADAATSVTEIEMSSIDLLGGLVHVSSLVQRYRAVSDGVKGVSDGSTILSGMEIGGIPVKADANGLVVDKQKVKQEDIASATKGLADALSAGGLTVKPASQRATDDGPKAGMEGDSLFVRGQVANGPTTYFLNFWLATGSAKASREAAPAVAPAPDAPAATATPAPQAATAGGLRATAAPAGARAPHFRPGAVAAGMGEPVLAPSAVPKPQGADDSAQAYPPVELMAATTPLSSATEGSSGLSRRALVGLFGAWQLLGVATVAAAALRAHKRRQHQEAP